MFLISYRERETLWEVTGLAVSSLPFAGAVVLGNRESISRNQRGIIVERQEYFERGPVSMKSLLRHLITDGEDEYLYLGLLVDVTSPSVLRLLGGNRSP